MERAGPAPAPPPDRRLEPAAEPGATGWAGLDAADVPVHESARWELDPEDWPFGDRTERPTAVPGKTEPAGRVVEPAPPLPAGATRRDLAPEQLLAFEAAMREPASVDRPPVSPAPQPEPEQAPGPARVAAPQTPSSDLDRLTHQDEGWLVAGDLASLAVIAALFFLNVANFGGLLRGVLALLFVTCVPGWALARAAGLAGGLSGLAVAVLASLTICAAASTAMLWLNVWHPLILLAGIGAVSAVALLWTLPAALVGARLRG